MATRMQQRRGTSTDWTTANPILAAGEIGFETDTNQFKIGDGLNTWADLSYFQTLEGLGTSLDDYVPLTVLGEPLGVATLDDNGNVPISQLGNLIDGAPEVLDTLNELAAAINDDPDFLSGKVSKSGDTMTGYLTLSGSPISDLQAATKLYVDEAEVNAVATAGDAADVKDSVVLAAAQGYADDAETSAKAYTDAREVAITTAYQSYADSAEADAKTYADQKVAELVDGSPALLDTLNELAAAINDDPSFSATIATSIGEKVAKSGDTMTGSLILNADPTTDLGAATKGYVDGAVEAEAVQRNGAIEAAVDAAISAEVVARDGAIASAVETAIDAEVVARDLAIEDAVSLAINTEVADRNSAITTALSQEAITRTEEITAAINDHSLDTIGVHGIADTAELATNASVADAINTHNLDTTNVHGIADTTALATKDYADDAVAAHNSDTTNVHGIADTSALALTADVNAALDLKQDKVAGVSDVEIGYLDGVTSAIQTQLDGKASTGHTHAQSDITGLTTDLAAKANLSGATFTGDVTVETDLIVEGNLTISGTTTTVNATDLVVSDPLIYIGEGNSANLVDLGIVSSFNDGTYQHSGIVRDSSAGKWKVFKGVTDEPTTTINFAQGSLDDLAVNNVEVAGVVFSDGTQTKQGVPSITTISAKTDSYTLSNLNERDTIIEISKSTATTLTIPADATVNYPVGTTLDIIQSGAGQVTIAGAGGVTVNATPGLKLRTQWSSATLLKRAANTWLVYGDLSA